jgi:hypothetical protein
MRADAHSMAMRSGLKQLRNRYEGLHVAPRSTNVYRDVQPRSADVAGLVFDKLIHQGCAASSRFRTPRRPACCGIILNLVEPVFQVSRIFVKFDSDLAERIDSSGTLRFPVMVFAAFLLSAEVARHCDIDCKC